MSERKSALDRMMGLRSGDGGDDPRAAQFARGLVLGAMVGAAIAGSTLWQRRRATPAPEPPAGDSGAVTGADDVATPGSDSGER